MEFLSTILQWLESAYESLIPWTVVLEYHGAVKLRFGRFHSELKPGPHWKWPLADQIITCEIATETIDVKSQSLVTKNGKDIVVSSIVKCNVSEPAIYIIKVKDVDNAIADIAKGKIKEVIMEKSWEECLMKDLDSEITKKVRHEAKKWGVYVEYVTVYSLASIRSIRLIQ